MTDFPVYYHNVSKKLASVLEDIGVNERIVQMRRKSICLCENLKTIADRMMGLKATSYKFGSQSEGTTTRGLKSDYDFFTSLDDTIVIQNKAEMTAGFMNLLMRQDELNAPGYCILQVDITANYYHLREVLNIIPTDSTENYKGYIVLKNTHLDEHDQPLHKHGPAFVFPNGYIEKVKAYPCKTLPKFLKTWLAQQQRKGRLTEDMKRYIESHPCYVVPVGRKGSPTEHLEWRISTAHAERCVMFNLNITQIQCYVLFKFMLQTHLKHPTEQGLSSFMCKNVLLLCIEDTEPEDWCPHNLLALFELCLRKLKQCVSEECCPHFIMHENNLMAGKFTAEVKHWLLDKIQDLYQGCIPCFSGLKIDDVGRRLQSKLNIKHSTVLLEAPKEILCDISGQKLYDLALQVTGAHKHILQGTVLGKGSLNWVTVKLIQRYYQTSGLEQLAISLLAPLIYSSLGSEMASKDIQQGKTVSTDALDWLNLGLDSDVASGRLKLASVYYCTGDYCRTETILRTVEKIYNKNPVEAVCNCIDHDKNAVSEEFRIYAYDKDKEDYSIRHAVAYGIKFLQTEIHCAPKELQYEMFRSTKEDLAEHRHKLGWDDWMDWAVVDSLPYLYFLQYKTYGHLQRHADQQKALNKLKCSILATQNLEHKETAMNLLGQCMEQEKLYSEAIGFYKMSLQMPIKTNALSPMTRLRNNAASLHICRLLNSLVSTRCHLA